MSANPSYTLKQTIGLSVLIVLTVTFVVAVVAASLRAKPDPGPSFRDATITRACNAKWESIGGDRQLRGEDATVAANYRNGWFQSCRDGFANIP